jgi:hypothetical protein
MRQVDGRMGDTTAAYVHPEQLGDWKPTSSVFSNTPSPCRKPDSQPPQYTVPSALRRVPRPSRKPCFQVPLTSQAHTRHSITCTKHNIRTSIHARYARAGRHDRMGTAPRTASDNPMQLEQKYHSTACENNRRACMHCWISLPFCDNFSGARTYGGKVKGGRREPRLAL